MGLLVFRDSAVEHGGYEAVDRCKRSSDIVCDGRDKHLSVMLLVFERFDHLIDRTSHLGELSGYSKCSKVAWI